MTVYYTFAYNRKEILDEMNAYMLEEVRAYKTLKGCINAIKHLIKEKTLSEGTKWNKLEQFIEKYEGKTWSGYMIVAENGGFPDPIGFTVKCVFIEDDPGEPSDDEDEDE